MADYINRERLYPFVARCRGIVVFNAVAAMEAIDNLPPDDLELVHHGRWLKNQRFKQKSRKCSECGFDSEFEFNFCPNCGAHMHGGGDG